MQLSAIALVALALLSSLFPSPAFAKSRLGFAVAVATEGFFSTTLTEVKVDSVKAGSPSEKTGLKPGDLIVELNGTPIKGASGLALKKTLAGVEHGDHVVLRVQRAGEGLQVIDIVAGLQAKRDDGNQVRGVPDNRWRRASMWRAPCRCDDRRHPQPAALRHAPSRWPGDGSAIEAPG